MKSDKVKFDQFKPTTGELPSECNLSIKFKYENVEQTFPFYAEQITANESFSRRDLIRTKVMNGTEVVTQGDWIGRDFTFTCHVPIADDPQIYDKYFQSMLHQPCKILSPNMGDMFDAQVTIKKEPMENHPNTLKLEVHVQEIPDVSDYWIDNVLQKEKRMNIVEK